MGKTLNEICLLRNTKFVYSPEFYLNDVKKNSKKNWLKDKLPVSPNFNPKLRFFYAETILWGAMRLMGCQRTSPVVMQH